MSELSLRPQYRSHLQLLQNSNAVRLESILCRIFNFLDLVALIAIKIVVVTNVQGFGIRIIGQRTNDIGNALDLLYRLIRKIDSPKDMLPVYNIAIVR